MPLSVGGQPSRSRIDTLTSIALCTHLRQSLRRWQAHSTPKSAPHCQRSLPSWMVRPEGNRRPSTVGAKFHFHFQMTAKSLYYCSSRQTHCEVENIRPLRASLPHRSTNVPDLAHLPTLCRCRLTIVASHRLPRCVRRRKPGPDVVRYLRSRDPSKMSSGYQGSASSTHRRTAHRAGNPSPSSRSIGRLSPMARASCGP